MNSKSVAHQSSGGADLNIKLSLGGASTPRTPLVSWCLSCKAGRRITNTSFGGSQPTFKLSSRGPPTDPVGYYYVITAGHPDQLTEPSLSWRRDIGHGVRLVQVIRAEKSETLELIISIRGTNRSFHSCNSCKWLGKCKSFTWVKWFNTSVCFIYRIYPFSTFNLFCPCNHLSPTQPLGPRPQPPSPSDSFQFRVTFSGPIEL